ncbi:CDP-alcohol phosphatidyltransferase family protein [uncultured Bacteroides sp.]|nr:CDP-alcohol phosphatidyltransferase family protein [uncultured Bacteroides sp.]
MGKESSNRIQTSLLNAMEKKALIWLAERQPSWMTSDMLTYIGLLGAVVCGLGFALAHIDKNYLWISSLGLVINWYGDSLDGTLARVRHTQRPIYGFFIDHTLDAVTICIMCIGAGISPMFRLDVAMLVLAGYLVLSIYTYISTIIKDEFRLTYGSFGPTEFRLVVILINTVFMYTPLSAISYTVGGQTLGVFDIAGLLIALFLFGAWLSQFLVDRRILAERDPLKPYNPEKKED